MIYCEIYVTMMWRISAIKDIPLKRRKFAQAEGIEKSHSLDFSFPLRGRSRTCRREDIEKKITTRCVSPPHCDFENFDYGIDQYADFRIQWEGKKLPSLKGKKTAGTTDC